MASLREHLLRIVPDEPRGVDLRALLLDSRSLILGDATGSIVLETSVGLAVVHGHPAIDEVNRTLALVPELLAPQPFEGLAPGWFWSRGVVMTLQDEASLREWQEKARGIVVPVDEHLLAQAPGPLRVLLKASMIRGSATCAQVAGQPVAFASAPLRSETYFDLSVDTLEAFRGRGLARMAAALLVDLERRSGREPVWGALESNAASVRAGMALGFRPVDHLWLACRRD